MRDDGDSAQGGDHEELRSHSTRSLFQRENQQDELMTEYIDEGGMNGKKETSLPGFEA